MKQEKEFNNYISTEEEKSQAIAHKDSALKRLDTSFNKHIELGEYKKSNILAYWINDFSNYHDDEKFFDSSAVHGAAHSRRPGGKVQRPATLSAVHPADYAPGIPAG